MDLTLILGAGAAYYIIMGLALVAVGASAAVSLQLPWQQIAVRVAGSWIAAMGLLIIGVA